MDSRPAIPVAIDADTNRVYIDSRTGGRVAAYNKTYTEYDAGRIRAGYVCINCDEAQREAFPEECWICAFPMKDEQAHRFGEEFEGYATVGPSKSLEELRLEDAEAKARARYAREKPTSGIWVPDV